MEKKYITLEEVLTLRGTDTKIYDDDNKDWTYCWLGDTLCRYKKDKLNIVGICVFDDDKLYILKPEEFKVEKAGKYKTRDGRIAYVTRIIEKHRYGIITGSSNVDTWKDSGIYCSSGVFISKGDSPNDLVEYIGD